MPLKFSFFIGKVGMGISIRGLCEDFKRNIYFKVWLDKQFLKTISNGSNLIFYVIHSKHFDYSLSIQHFAGCHREDGEESPPTVII